MSLIKIVEESLAERIDKKEFLLYREEILSQLPDYLLDIADDIRIRNYFLQMIDSKDVIRREEALYQAIRELFKKVSLIKKAH